jgi:hypothetical protein
MDFNAFMRASGKANFADMVITIVHTGSIQDQMFIRWAAVHDFAHILAYGVQGKSNNGHALEKYCHQTIFKMPLTFSGNDNEEKKIAAAMIDDVSSLDTDASRNIIVVTKPTPGLLNAIALSISNDKSSIKHTILINSAADHGDLNSYKNLHIISAQSILAERVQKQMSGIPCPLPIDPLFFSFALLWMAQSNVSNEMNSVDEDNGRCVITINNMDAATETLSDFVHHVFDVAVPRPRLR